jgi:hypothetical protein
MKINRKSLFIVTLISELCEALFLSILQDAVTFASCKLEDGAVENEQKS